MRSISILPALTSALVAIGSVEAAAVPPQRPMIDSQQLQAMVSKDRLLQRAKELQDIADRNGKTRKWGTKGHEETVMWIKKEMEATGYYDVSLQEFTLPETTYDNLVTDFSDGTKPKARLVPKNGWNGKTSGQLIYLDVSPCSPSEITSDISGKIILMPFGGNCSPVQILDVVHNARAAGVIMHIDIGPVPPQDGYVIQFGPDETKEITMKVPAVLIDQATGESLAAKLKGAGAASMEGGYYGYGDSSNSAPSATGITVSLEASYRIVDKKTWNVIAESKTGDRNKVITAGAHSDSVLAGPGINDDGSGTITQMELAIAMSKFELKNAMRWCWWTAEEDGLLGSKHYATTLSEEEKAKIVMNLDFDMLASPNPMYGVYDGDGSTHGAQASGPSGAGHIEQTFIDFYKAKNISTEPIPFDGRSDYASFNEVGIPSGGIAAGAEGIKQANQTALWGGETGVAFDKCYHQACDTVENLNMGAWFINSQCVADSVAKYTLSIEGFPFPRTNTGGPGPGNQPQPGPGQQPQPGPGQQPQPGPGDSGEQPIPGSGISPAPGPGDQSGEQPQPAPGYPLGPGEQPVPGEQPGSGYPPTTGGEQPMSGYPPNTGEDQPVSGYPSFPVDQPMSGDQPQGFITTFATKAEEAATAPKHYYLDTNHWEFRSN